MDDKRTMMVLKEAFEQAVTDSKSLSEKPGNSILLEMYSLYKQATIGDAPKETNFSMFDFVAEAKHNAWKALKGMSHDEAMQKYIDLISALKSK